MGKKKKIKDIRVNCLPRKGVVAASIGDRAIARIVKSRLTLKPDGDAQKDLVGDTFFAMLKQNPVCKEEVSPDRVINKTLMEWAMDAPTFNTARASTINNVPSSLVASSVLWYSLITEDALQEALKRQKEIEEMMKKAQEEYDKMTQCAMDGDSEGAGKHQAAGNRISEQARKAAMEAAGKIEKLKKNPLAQGMMNQKVKMSAEKGEEVAATMQAWGLESGSRATDNVDDILDLMRESMDIIREIGKLAGRFKNASSSTIEEVRRSYTGSTIEPAMIKDPLKLFPTELNYLSEFAPPLLRAQKVGALVSGGLLGWKEKSEGKNSGNAVFMVDESGSMSWGYSSSHETIDNGRLAKAIALGIAWALKDDKNNNRNYQLAGFATESDGFPAVSSKESWEKHVEWAGEFINGGGTDFDVAINYAIDKLSMMNKEGSLGADLVFITDGHANMQDTTVIRWKQFNQDTGARLIYISIGDFSNEEVKELSDTYIEIHDADDLTGKAEGIVQAITSSIIHGELSLKNGGN